jgi:23S rRNA pseudouridine2605 synthase
VLVAGVVESTTIRRLINGVDLEDGRAAAVSARIVDRSSDTSLVEVTMGEGRKRIVRRMFDAVGHPVQRLVRTSIGPLRDTSLSPGQCRPLTIEEIRALYQAGEGAVDG